MDRRIDSECAAVTIGRRAALGLLITVILGAVGVVLLPGAARSHGAATIARSKRTHVRPTQHRRPNIVFILTDDLSWNLINKRFAPHIVALERKGETFRNYFVADSLCCPSRATIFTGLFPHDTKVVTNEPPDGGYEKFQSQHLAKRTFALALHNSGYRTSMLGKYLNDYGDPAMNSRTAPIPPGWSDWHVSNSTGYLEYNYLLNDNGRIDSYGGPGARGGPSGASDSYGVDVIGAWARKFIAASARRPFMVEAATFAPHAPFIPARRNANDFPGLNAPRDPSFNSPNVNPPRWLARIRHIGPAQLAKLNEVYRKRAQSVEAVDRLVATVEATLAAHHLAKNTYIVFSSDNGYHIGQHQLTRGKQTAFDTDIRVPLIIAGPGVPPGRSVRQMVQSVDLYPTFVALAGAKTARPADGHSLIPLLHPGDTRLSWPTVALIEHHHLKANSNDPDFEEGRKSGDPTTYEAIRINSPHLPGFRGPVRAVYVEYQDPEHELEYYNITKDPFERDNTARQLTAPQRAELHKLLAGLEHCHNTTACWRAARASRLR